MMKAVRFGILVGLVLATVLAGARALIAPQPVRAAACGAGPLTPVINKVQPSSISNATQTTITVRGSGFEDGAIVVLESYGVLETTCVSSDVLTAVVPAGVPGEYNGKQYDVTVINPSGSSTKKHNALTVVTPIPTATPGAPEPTAFVCPILTVQSYGASSPQLISHQDIDFEMTLQNLGQAAATNVVVTFTAGDLIPRTTGGVQALGTIAPGQSVRFFQPFTTGSLSGSVAVLDVQVDYTDATGTAYTSAFKLTFPVAQRGGAAAPTPTPTPQPLVRPQLVIDRYTVDVERLLPGLSFTLTLEVHNRGTADAKGVTMIAGGGTVSEGGEGTPTAGGISGGSGEFTNFAPVGSSNVQLLGDLASNAALTATQNLVVNVSTNPGAYPFKVSFTYVDPTGRRYVDDQVITLLVYTPVQVDVGFYRDPNPIFAGQPNALPLQVTNLGRAGVVFGNMEVTAEGAQLTNNIILVGRLDSGGYFTMDAMLIPDQPGPLTLTVTLNYSDDFNEPQTITRTLEVEVQEMSFPEPGMEGGEMPPDRVPQSETLLQRIWRFIRGLLGLDSGVPTTPGGPGEYIPTPGEEVPLEGEGGVIIVTLVPPKAP